MGFVSVFSRHVCANSQSPIGCSLCGTSGFVSGTPILTKLGARDVETLQIGDLLPTLEHGLQPLSNITREDIWIDPGNCPHSVLPFHVPAQALGNALPFLLLPENSVLVPSRSVEATGLSEAVIQSAELGEFSGILPVQPPGQTTVHKLRFENEELIDVAQGAFVVCQPEVMPLDVGAAGLMSDTTASGIPKLNRMQTDAFLLLLEDAAKLNASDNARSGRLKALQARNKTGRQAERIVVNK